MVNTCFTGAANATPSAALISRRIFSFSLDMYWPRCRQPASLLLHDDYQAAQQQCRRGFNDGISCFHATTSHLFDALGSTIVYAEEDHNVRLPMAFTIFHLMPHTACCHLRDTLTRNATISLTITRHIIAFQKQHRAERCLRFV